MPLETITVTVQAGSANPQTKQVTVNVDPNTGAGSSTVSFTGVNGGLDTIKATATIAGTPYTSNGAFVGWQATNGVVSLINDMILEKHPGQGCHTNWNGTFAGPTGQFFKSNTLVYNNLVANNPIPGYPNNEQRTGPVLANTVNPDGTAQNPPNGVNVGWGAGIDSGNFTNVFVGSFVVTQAGIHTFYFWVDDAWALYMGQGTSRNNGTFTINGGNSDAPLSASGVAPSVLPAAQAILGGSGIPAFPALGMRNTSGLGSPGYVYVNFPAPGIYNFLMWWVNDCDSAQAFVCTFAPGASTVPSSNGIYGGTIKPVTRQAAPPATTPSGNVSLSVQGTASLIAGQTVTLNVNVSGIHYATKPYVPILEGQTGKLYLYNSSTSNVFNFQTYNGQPVDKPSAAGAAFAISGNNGSWQGRLSIVYDAGAGQFELAYNGNNFDSHVDTTQLTVQSDDIAWFNSTNKTYDTFVPSLSGGGNFYSVEIDYMVKPSVASVSPGSLSADGQTHNFTVSLDRPFSPQQQGAKNTGNVINTPIFTFPGGTVGTPVANLDGAGWLTGWTVPITVPFSQSNSSVAMGMTLTGVLTRLVNDTFVQGGVNYIGPGTIANIQLTGSSAVAPTIQSITVTPKTGVAPNYSVSDLSTETLTATVSSPFNNNITATFFAQSHGTSTRETLGATSTPSSSFTSGGLFYKVFTISSPAADWFSLNDIGVQATDTVNNLSSPVFFDSSTYRLIISGGGGGGGGGCPAVEMFLDKTTAVCEAEVGTVVSSLPLMFYGELKQEMAMVENIEFSTEICWLVETSNGAAVIVSGSTPIPTMEACEAMHNGSDLQEVTTLAQDIVPGMHVVTDVGNGLEWADVISCLAVGPRRVAKLSCGGRNFAAGIAPGKYIYTHNLLAIVK